MKKEVSVRAAATLPVEYAEKNSIARGVWACSPSTYKIISLACSLLSNGKTQDGYWVEFSMPGLIKALGIKDGTATRALYDKSIKDAFGSCIEYEITGKDGNLQVQVQRHPCGLHTLQRSVLQEKPGGNQPVQELIRNLLLHHREVMVGDGGKKREQAW